MLRESSGELLLEKRLEAGLTQKALAEKSGVSERTIRRIETGGEKPQSATVRALARALGCPYAALLGLEWDLLEGGDAWVEYIDPTDPEGYVSKRY